MVATIQSQLETELVSSKSTDNLSVILLPHLEAQTIYIIFVIYVIIYTLTVDLMPDLGVKPRCILFPLHSLRNVLTTQLFMTLNYFTFCFSSIKCYTRTISQQSYAVSPGLNVSAYARTGARTTHEGFASNCLQRSLLLRTLFRSYVKRAYERVHAPIGEGDSTACRQHFRDTKSRTDWRAPAFLLVVKRSFPCCNHWRAGDWRNVKAALAFNPTMNITTTTEAFKKIMHSQHARAWTQKR